VHWERGLFARQAHVSAPSGTFEEEHGRQGFDGRASELYHLRPPTSWKHIDGPLHLHAFDTNTLGDGRTPLLMSYEPYRLGRGIVVSIDVYDTSPDHYRRNADADELHFVHAGSGVVETDYGDLTYRPGDYVYLPRGTTARFVPEAPTHAFVIEAIGDELGLPPRGPLGRHAVTDPAMFDVPEPNPRDERVDVEVRVQARGETTRFVFNHHPLDVVGWRGDLAPMRLNVEAIRPVVAERYHLPPPVHATFQGRESIVATLVPRPTENSDETMVVPYYHRNAEYDEVMFFHTAAMNRPGIGAGWMRWNPMGVTHGRTFGAVQREVNRELPDRHTEIMVMLDTRFALDATPAASTIEWDEYWTQWTIE